MREAFVIALAVVGLAFSLSAAVGVLRMPDVYSRIQCASKTVTMGALPVLVALVVGRGVLTPFGSRALLVAVLLLVVNPASSHALARAAYKAGVPMWPGAVRDDAKAAHQRRKQSREQHHEQHGEQDGAQDGAQDQAGRPDGGG